jgi:hypothetical protein
MQELSPGLLHIYSVHWRPELIITRQPENDLFVVIDFPVQKLIHVQ